MAVLALETSSKLILETNIQKIFQLHAIKISTTRIIMKHNDYQGMNFIWLAKNTFSNCPDSYLKYVYLL